MMSIFPILFVAFVLILLALDFVFLPKSARRTWAIMAAAFFAAGFFALFPETLGRVSRFLGVGRPVDVLIYVLLIVLVREYFIARIRFHAQQRQFTDLVRSLALQNARDVDAGEASR